MHWTPDGRYWLLTWTTFGTWLPGDRRGSASPLRTGAVTHDRMNVLGEPAAPPQPHLERWTRARLSAPPVHLTAERARALVEQFHETAHHRRWKLIACAVMHNHVHLVVLAGSATPSADVLGDLKAYGSRALNRLSGRPRRWWTSSGSRRELQAEANVLAAVRYVRQQHQPLYVWAHDDVMDANP